MLSLTKSVYWPYEVQLFRRRLLVVHVILGIGLRDTVILVKLLLLPSTQWTQLAFKFSISLKSVTVTLL